MLIVLACPLPLSLHHHPTSSPHVPKHPTPVRLIPLALLLALTRALVPTDGPPLGALPHDAPANFARDIFGTFDLGAVHAGALGRAAAARVERRGGVDAFEQGSLGRGVDGACRELHGANAALGLGEGAAVVLGLGGGEVALAVIAWASSVRCFTCESVDGAWLQSQHTVNGKKQDLLNQPPFF